MRNRKVVGNTSLSPDVATRRWGTWTTTSADLDQNSLSPQLLVVEFSHCLISHFPTLHRHKSETTRFSSLWVNYNFAILDLNAHDTLFTHSSY